MDFFVNNIHTIVFFPLWIAVLVILGRFFDLVQSRRVIALMTLASTLYGIVFSIGCFLYLKQYPDFVYETSFPFLKIEDYVLNFGIYLDNLSAVMILLVTTISFVVQFYSINYMWKDKSFSRFFAYLNLFNFSMLGLVLSPNLFQNYVFWELVGVSSYLLIGFWYKKPSASNAAKKAFIVNRIGDTGLLAGTIAVSYFMYQYASVNTLAAIPFINLEDVGSYLYSFTNTFYFDVICILLLLGAIAKSAQLPLHTWLPDAMEGPTPISALIHSATMVAAGVYLIARLYPIFSLSDEIMTFIAVIGLLSALVCAFIAITRRDLKRILAYSTISQLGLMFLALGAGIYAGGLFHLVTHAYFKSMLFLCSGIVIHSLGGQNDVRFMGGLRKFMPTVAICYLIACFAVSGLLFSGFYSKEMILKFLLANNYYLYAIGFLIVSLMTAFYIFRSYFLVFEGEFKGDKNIEKPHFILNTSIIIFALITVLIGGNFEHGFKDFIQTGFQVIQTAKAVNPLFISLSVAVLGLLSAYLFYNTRVKPFKIPVLYQLSYNKLYIENFYNFITDKIYYSIAKICAIIDKYIIDGFVKFVSFCTRATAWIFGKLQTGNVQSYINYSVIFLAIIFVLLMLAYTMVILLGILDGGLG